MIVWLDASWTLLLTTSQGENILSKNGRTEKRFFIFPWAQSKKLSRFLCLENQKLSGRWCKRVQNYNSQSNRVLKYMAGIYYLLDSTWEGENYVLVIIVISGHVLPVDMIPPA